MVSRRGTIRTELAALGPYIDSFDLVLNVNDISPRTREMYTDVARWYASWLLDQGVTRWADAGVDQLRAFFLHIKGLGYEQSYRNNIGRCVQAFHKFLTAEEDLPNPFDRVKPPPPPKLGEKPVPVLVAEQMKALIADAEKGRDFQSRRDAALLRMFASTGCRLAEVTTQELDQLNLKERSVQVCGKGSKWRGVKFDAKCALALDRYLRKRAEHPAAGLPVIWLGVKRRTPMTPNGVRRSITRRGEATGIHVHPHLFRHTFSHNWLDAGGSEGDLMELNGWESPAMLRHYGRSARGARARRAYDRIDVMRGV